MGDRLFVADIKLFHAYNWFAGGAVDHIPKDVFGSYPKFTSLFDAVAKHPRIAEWRARFM